MSRFHTLLNRAYREIITEQEQPPVPQGTPEQASPTPIPEIPEAQPQPQSPVKPLTSEGETVLVRILAKAILVDITDPVDELSVKDISENKINAENAQESLTKLVSIIRKYDQTVSGELDIDKIFQSTK
jgi:hypothetical protein